MLYKEIITVCSQIHTKHINTLCEQNVELLNVKLTVHTVTIHPVSIRTLLVFLHISAHPAPFSNSPDRFRSYLCVFTFCSRKLSRYFILVNWYLSHVQCYFQPALFQTYGDWALTRLSGCCQTLLTAAGSMIMLLYSRHSLYPSLYLFSSLSSASFANIYRVQDEIWGSHSCFAQDASLLGCDAVSLREELSAFERILMTSFTFTVNQLIKAVVNQTNWQLTVWLVPLWGNRRDEADVGDVWALWRQALPTYLGIFR